MMFLLRVLYALVVLFILVSYNIVSSIILLFIPRILRRKKNIKGQRVLITGAGSGVGRELAIEFSKHGTCLILVDINRQALLETEKLLDRCSPVFIYECDVSDYKKVYEMARQVLKDAGDVDILVNNAGIVSGKFLWDLPEEKIVKTMEVNALAHFWTCKAFLPAMMEKNRGHIVSIISIAGKSGGPGVSDYCASKHAALGFAESLEMELRAKKLNGIKVTTVCPSIIDTKLFKGAEFKYLSFINLSVLCLLGDYCASKHAALGFAESLEMELRAKKLNGIKVTTVCPSIIDTKLFKGAEFKIGSKLSPEYVAKEVVAGVLENKEIIVLPAYFTILMAIKELTPRWIQIRIHEILGNMNLMDNFVGREEQSRNGTDVNDKSKKRE